MNYTKTVHEWFNELPEEYKELALTNIDPAKKNISYDTKKEALLFGFAWWKSSEGFVFWDELYKKI